MDGIQILREARTVNPATPVILITAYGSIDSAVTAMKEGASDYLTKPFAMDELLLILRRLLRLKQLEEENVALRKFEKEYIQSVLEKTRGKKGEAAEILGISRKTLWEKIKGLEIEI